MAPFAPPRFSITTGWPSASAARGPNSRTYASIPPGGEPTIRRMGLAGNACPAASAGTSAAAAAQRATDAFIETSLQGDRRAIELGDAVAAELGQREAHLVLEDADGAVHARLALRAQAVRVR